MRAPACLVLLSLLALSATASAQPEISRAEIFEIAASGVGSPYVWGGGCWDPANRSRLGADCSGYVAKTWQVPERSAVTSCSHPYTTATFYNERTHWDAVDRAAAEPADAFVRRADGSGHVVLYAGGDPWGASEVYEARGTAYGIVHRTSTRGSEYVARRRRALAPDGPPEHPLITLSAEIDTIDGQARDLCSEGGSAGLFDVWQGQELTERLYVANEGTASAADLVVGVQVSSRLAALHWEIFTDWDGAGCGEQWCPNDANSHPDNPSHDLPGTSFILHMNQLSPGETKMIILDLSALEGSFGEGASPEVRIWVRAVRDFYDKESYDSSFDNVDGLQTWNGGDLRTRSSHTVLADESCNGVDDDCDGLVDEDIGVGEPCTVGEGACAASGVLVCAGHGGEALCDAVAGTPAEEICNGEDDDCDGAVDEGCPGGDVEPPDDDDGGGDGGGGGPGSAEELLPALGGIQGSCACRATPGPTGASTTLTLLCLVALVARRALRRR